MDTLVETYYLAFKDFADCILTIPVSSKEGTIYITDDAYEDIISHMHNIQYNIQMSIVRAEYPINILRSMQDTIEDNISNHYNLKKISINGTFVYPFSIQCCQYYGIHFMINDKCAS